MDAMLELLMAVKSVHRELEHRYNGALRPLGVTAVQAEAILIIDEHQRLSVRALGAQMLAESGHPSRLVERLVASGWVCREQVEDDRRHVALTLTAEGVALSERIHAARQPLLVASQLAMHPADLEAVLMQVRRLLDLLQSLPDVVMQPGPADEVCTGR